MPHEQKCDNRGSAAQAPNGFLADLDMFDLGTANAEGQPYIQ